MKTQLAILSLLILTACGQLGDKDATPDATVPPETPQQNPFLNQQEAVALLEAKSGSDLKGKVTFTERNGIVSMKAEIRNVPEGMHAIHIHAAGDCSSEDAKSAGGHWNPTDEDHGKWDKQPFHRGDIGNINVNADGVGSIERQTDLWCIGCSDESKNIVGKAIIVHEGPDDFSSQPSGAAGARIGCGKIVRH